jgi:hypothetical protein
MQLDFDVGPLALGAVAYAAYRICVKVLARSEGSHTRGADVQSNFQAEVLVSGKLNLDCHDTKFDNASEHETDLEMHAKEGTEPEEECGPRENDEVEGQQKRLALVVVIVLSLVVLLCAVCFRRAYVGRDGAESGDDAQHISHVDVEMDVHEAEDTVHKPENIFAVYGEGLAAEEMEEIEQQPNVIAPIVWDGKAWSFKVTRQKVTETYVNGVLTEYISAYYATLNIGSSLDEFTFLVDTGSANVIMPNEFCKSQSCQMHNRYSKSNSRSSEARNLRGMKVGPNDKPHEITIGFGTGEITGVFMEDIVCADKNTLLNVSSDLSVLPPGCSRMTFIAANEMSDFPFSKFPFDGVLGLGLTSLSVESEFNFIRTLCQRSNMPHMFGLFLARGTGESSELSVGGFELSHLEGGRESDLTWVPVSQPELGHWMVKLRSLRVDGAEIDFCKDDCYAVLDSGTALNAVPNDVFKTIYMSLQHPSALDGRCQEGGPQLQFDLDGIGTATMSLGAADYSRPQVYAAKKKLNFGPTIKDNRTIRSDMFCRPLLMVMDLENPMPKKVFILGEPALQRHYTVFDSDKMRIGFGIAKQATKVSPRSVAADALEEGDDEWFFDEDEEP